jgi:hypothetical protein
MRFLTFIKSDESMPAGPPPPALFAAIDEFGQQATKDGTLLDTGGLLPSGAGGAQVRVADGKITVTDGPFTESKEVIGGYAMFQLRSKEEAVEQARRFMELHVKHWPGFEGVSEVRQIAEPGDFDPSAPPQ